MHELRKVAVFVLLISLCGIGPADVASTEERKPEVNPAKVLEAGRQLAEQGNYSAALQKYIWYHHNATKYDPSSKWMRLSVALGLWVELGRKYPAARQALILIRNAKADELLNGKGDFSVFNDLSAINQALGESSKSIELFNLLDRRRPELASRCWGLVKTAIIIKQDKELLNKYLKSPHEEFQQIKFIYEQLKSADVSDRDEIKKYAENNFVKRICELVDALKAVGRDIEARKICQMAAVLVKSADFDAALAARPMH
ncbi:hypothetical protein P0136_12735 [Lentisphaerota bacterium ZTH]|nr:hypothetical protein JYG24_09750 [Lentisphaerota bacterium]WET06223.1 hypothetical protein P0136_12735 [Lentisphaerota bacterium ZTH]